MQLKIFGFSTAEILDLGGGFAEERDPSSHDLSRLAAPAEEYARAVAEGVREGCREHGFPFPRLWKWFRPFSIRHFRVAGMSDVLKR